MLPSPAAGQELPQGLGAAGDNWVIDGSTGTPVDCSLWSNILNLTCWNPLAQSTSEPQSSNYGGASNPAAAMAAMTPDQLAQYNANQAVIDSADQQISQTLSPTGILNPLSSAPGKCTSTLVTGVCDSTLKTMGILFGIGVGAVLLLNKKRR